MLASDGGHEAVVKLLLEAGADVAATSQAGRNNEVSVEKSQGSDSSHTLT